MRRGRGERERERELRICVLKENFLEIYSQLKYDNNNSVLPLRPSPDKSLRLKKENLIQTFLQTKYLRPEEYV